MTQFDCQSKFACANSQRPLGCTTYSILLVECDGRLSQRTRDALRYWDFEVEIVSDNAEAKMAMGSREYDLLLLSSDFPEMSALEMCLYYREHGGTSPVFLLTSKDRVEDKIKGFEAGADDYLIKPFDLNELIARMRVHLRRTNQDSTADENLQSGTIQLDPFNHRVFRGQEEVKLMPKEFAILELLMRHPGQIFDAGAILKRIRGSSQGATPDVVRTYIKTIRKKLGTDDIIETVHSLGYRIKSD
jgi:two-component system, OmpR family, response regulator